MLKPAYHRSALDAPQEFSEALVSWFLAHAEDYPWRQTQDPYEILVSEVMLQQTTVQAVVENRRFERFLEEFPTVQVLAEASEEAILRAWEGLGYYNRVRNLRETAREVVATRQGVFPETLAGLRALPGVGDYTSAAVASFAYNISAPLVDANVARVLMRLFNDPTEVDTTPGKKVLWARAEQLVSQTQARAYNAALMELGQQVCKARETHCMECPVALYCASKDPLSLPKKKPKKKATEVTEYAVWHQNAKGEVYLDSGEGSRRKGMWTLPIVEQEETVGLRLLDESMYTITRYKVSLRVYEGEVQEGQKGRWVSAGELELLPLPSPLRRVIMRLLSGA